jgi:hypothetical protein
MGECKLDLSGSRKGSFGSVKSGAFLDYLSGFKVLKKNSYSFSPLEPNGKEMYRLLYQSVILHSMFMGFNHSHCKQ